MSKLHITDTAESVFIKMSEGNPGAAQVVFELLQSEPLELLTCDTIGLYGEKLYMLWNDCCNRDMAVMHKVLLAYRTGRVSADEIHEHLSGGYGRPFAGLEIKKEENQ